MRLSLVSDPATEPLELAEAKKHLKVEVEVTDDDTLIADLILAARDYAERETGRQLVSATWDGKLDCFPHDVGGEIELPLPPLLSVEFIKYLDATGALVTWPGTEYVVDAPIGPHARAGRVYLAYGKTWPVTRQIRNAVTVQFKAGYGATVPQGLREAMLLVIGHWYRNREAVITGTIVSEVPASLQTLIRQYAVSQFVMA